MKDQGKYNTIMELMTVDHKYIDIIKHFGTISLSDIFERQPKGMRRLAKQYSEDRVINAVAALLCDTSLSYDKKWSQDKAILAAYELYHSEYYYLSIEDIFLILQNIKSNEFSYTPATFRKYVKRHAEARLQLAESNQHNHHYANKFKDGEQINKLSELDKHREASKTYKRIQAKTKTK